MQITSEAFERLYKDNHRQLYITAYRIVNDADSAEDIVQDVFLKLWSQRDTLDIIHTEKGYLHKATVNTSLNVIRRSARLLRIGDHMVNTHTSSEAASEAVSLNELQSKVREALNRLPTRCRTVFVLSRFEGMKYKQIAEHLGISVNTVENQMVKALEIMRQELKPFLGKEFLLAAISFGVSALIQLLSVPAVLFIIPFIK